jgi:ABC-2 type transport system ATP-binding protein
MPEHAAISTDALTRRFGDDLAVDHVNLHVPRQSVYGFLGPNGAGKSTTIRMLLGLLSPDEGQVQLLGMPFEKHREALLEEVGSLVEAPSLYVHLTGRENLRLASHMRPGVSESEVQEVLETVSLHKAADQRVGAYSLGMKQRLGIALALLGDPALLILDEPTNGLDPAGMRKMRRLIRDLPDQSEVTVFLSSHLLGEVERVATHVGIIWEGTLLFQGTTDELKAQKQAHVAVETSRPEKAQRVLGRAGLDSRPDEDGRLQVYPGDDATAARCATVLVQAGLEVYHLGVEETSLEATFLALTDSETE